MSEAWRRPLQAGARTTKRQKNDETFWVYQMEQRFA